MSHVEDAYKELGKAILDFIQGREWDQGICRCTIYTQMVSTSCSLKKDGKLINKAIGWGDSTIDTGGAALLLRDNLIQTTGQRIWGLTFTLYPTGKFNIEYDYNKPEGYEETEEVITGAEINQNLSDLKKQKD